MTTPTTRRLRRAALALPLAAALVLGACGDDDDDADATTTTAAEAAPATRGAGDAPPGPAEGSGPEEVEVRLVDYSFEDLPASVPAGTRLRIVNESEGELHELVALRIPDEETRPVSELVTLPEDEIDAAFGEEEPVAVLLAPNGGDQIEAVGDGTLSEPGRYALVCAIPTGVDPQAFLDAPPSDGPPSVPGADGPPHLAHGMWAELLVE